MVHGKGSLIGKMPGDDWQKFANARAYLAFMWAHPGKKLLFMGQEFGQTSEWTETRRSTGTCCTMRPHQGLSRCVGDLNRLYRDHPALHGRDCEGEGFQWIEADDAEQSVLAWMRRSPGAPTVAFVVNFTPVPRYGLSDRPAASRPLARGPQQRRRVYGGSGKGNLGGVTAYDHPHRDFPASARVNAPPLAALDADLRSGLTEFMPM